MYQLIYADPPWRYQNKGVNGAAENHYQTLTLEDMKRLPVWSIAADDAVLCMWFTGTHVDEAKELATAWGFEVRTMKGLTWVKLNELAWQHIEKRLREQDVIDFHDFLELLNTQTRMNGGTYTRANSEDMLIAVRGAGLERAAMNVKQVVYSCLGEHSQKPAEARYRIEQLYGNVSRIELFSRGDAAGWHHWGNENPFNDIELVPATFTTPPRRVTPESRCWLVIIWLFLLAHYNKASRKIFQKLFRYMKPITACGQPKCITSLGRYLNLQTSPITCRTNCGTTLIA